MYRVSYSITVKEVHYVWLASFTCVNQDWPFDFSDGQGYVLIKIVEHALKFIREGAKLMLCKAMQW